MLACESLCISTQKLGLKIPTLVPMRVNRSPCIYSLKCSTDNVCRLGRIILYTHVYIIGYV